MADQRLVFIVPVEEQVYNDADPARDAGDICLALHEFKVLAYYSK